MRWAPAGEVGAQVTGWEEDLRTTLRTRFSCWGDPWGLYRSGNLRVSSPTEVLVALLSPVFFLQHLCRHPCPGRALGAPFLRIRPCARSQSPRPGLPSERPGTTMDHHACRGQPSPTAEGIGKGSHTFTAGLPPSPPFTSSWALCLQQPANASHAAMGLDSYAKGGYR